MEFKFNDYRYSRIGKQYYPIVKEALEELGHTEWEEPYYEAKTDSAPEIHSSPELYIYNHCHQQEIKTDNNLIIKPTGPTSKHFAIDTIGYANSSSLAFDKPRIYKEYDINHDIQIHKWKEEKANKWDDSILLKWKKSKKEIPLDHVLIICQQPKDETVNGFGFGNHWEKVCQIVENVSNKTNFPIVVKLHPSQKGKIQQIKDWEEKGIHVIKGYISIHEVLPKTRVAILENSTAGIECLMHDVPIVSYGFPEYHWVTKQLQSLTQLEDLVYDLSWHDPIDSRKFLNWYVFDYLCTDINSTVNRLKQLI